MPSGRWLVETSRPLTSAQLSTARDIAAGAGLTIESRDEQQGLAALRTGATAFGILLALGVLAMTVGLIRSEAAADMRILTATGATSGTRRTLTAATAGALAFLGVVLGTAGAYVALMAGHARDLGQLSPIPVVHLAAIVVGTPLAAAGAGWLLAGREPQHARPSGHGMTCADDIGDAVVRRVDARPDNAVPPKTAAGTVEVRPPVGPSSAGPGGCSVASGAAGTCARAC